MSALEPSDELGIELRGHGEFGESFGDRPFFLTMTETAGEPSPRHVAVSLWFVLAGQVGQSLRPNPREFAQVRWWAPAGLRQALDGRFGPHLLRALAALKLDR